MKELFSLFLLATVLSSPLCAGNAVSEQPVKLGIDVLRKNHTVLKGKRVGLITNPTGVNNNLTASAEIILCLPDVKLVALFGPEHGIKGGKMGNITESGTRKDIRTFSLHSAVKRPTAEMLKGIDTLVFDIQDIGARSYTYISTMRYCMEEAAKYNIQFVVLDRPNPLGGLLIDGPLLDMNFESFVGPAVIPYIHGMTIGEIALLLNKEMGINCNLTVIKMENWKRSMLWEDTKLLWTPTSPHIPEPDTPFFYPMTGILGELGIVNIGVGYTLPFKLVGAPWINANEIAYNLNSKKLSGVHFQTFHFTPFYGLYKDKECNGVRIIITNKRTYQPVAIGYYIIETLMTLYPENFNFSLIKTANIDMFDKVNGTNIIRKQFQAGIEAKGVVKAYQPALKEFIKKRTQYLLYE